jgi:hypothetical protein
MKVKEIIEQLEKYMKYYNTSYFGKWLEKAIELLKTLDQDMIV